MDIDAAVRRQSELEDRRSNWESLWEEVAVRLFPRGDDFRSRHPDGATRTNRQYDAFPQMALNRFAAAMEAGLTPRNARWHDLSTGDPFLDDDDEVKAYLEGLNDQLWNTRYAPRTNFASQNHEALLGTGAFGTAGMFIEEDPRGGARYRAIHLSELFLAENFQGVIDTVHRKFEMTVRQIVQRFGDEALPQKVAEKYEKGHLGDKFEILHVVAPREDYEKGRLDAKGMRWADAYILLDSKDVLREGGYHEFPYAIARYVTSAREVYGRGPGIMLLPDIKMLQEMRRTVIEAANMIVDPPTLLHDDGILGEFRLEPGARNYGAVSAEGRQLAVPFQSGAKVEIGLEMIQDLKAQIDDAFLGVYFRVLLENPQMTATQALLIAQQQGQMTAPVIGRMQSEYLGTLIRRESGILFRQGRHPPMPEKLAQHLQSTGRRLEIEYTTPMTRAARAEDAVAIARTFEALTPWAQVQGPSVFRRFDVDEIAEILADINGVPQKALKTEAQVEAEDEQAAAQQAMAAALEAAPVAADVARTMDQTRREAGVNPERVA